MVAVPTISSKRSVFHHITQNILHQEKYVLLVAIKFQVFPWDNIRHELLLCCSNFCPLLFPHIYAKTNTIESIITKGPTTLLHIDPYKFRKMMHFELNVNVIRALIWEINEWIAVNFYEGKKHTAFDIMHIKNIGLAYIFIVKICKV